MSASFSAIRARAVAMPGWLRGSGLVVLCAAIAKLLVHLYAGRNYGYFTDELYYLACARHLAWGYVDQPPLIAFVTRLGTLLFGESLPAIRFLPAVAGAGKIVLTGMIARELGGGRFAQGLRHQRPPELFPVGTARLYGRERDCAARPARPVGAGLLQCRKARTHFSFLFNAQRTGRHLLLPRPEGATEATLAHGQELALSSGRHDPKPR